MTITQPKLFQRCYGKDCPERLKCWRNQKPLEKLNVWYQREYHVDRGCEYFVQLPVGFTAVVDRGTDPLMRPSRDD